MKQRIYVYLAFTSVTCRAGYANLSGASEIIPGVLVSFLFSMLRFMDCCLSFRRFQIFTKPLPVFFRLVNFNTLLVSFASFFPRSLKYYEILNVDILMCFLICVLKADVSLLNTSFFQVNQTDGFPFFETHDKTKRTKQVENQYKSKDHIYHQRSTCPQC